MLGTLGKAPPFVSINHSSCCWDKILDRNNVRKGGIIWAHAQGRPGRDSGCSCGGRSFRWLVTRSLVRKQREVTAGVSVLSSSLSSSVQDPRSWDSATHNQNGLPQLNLSKRPLQTGPEVCPRDGSQSSQVTVEIRCHILTL